MDAAGVKGWAKVKAMILESYRLIAPRKAVAKLQTERATRRNAKKTGKGPRRPKTRRA